MITTINKLRLIYFFIFLILLTKNLIANDQKMQKISNFSIEDTVALIVAALIFG